MTLYTVIHVTSVVKLVHIFIVRSRTSKSCVITELCFHRSAFWLCSDFFFGCHHKQCVSDKRNFTFVKFILRCSVALTSPLRTKRLCYCSETVRSIYYISAWRRQQAEICQWYFSFECPSNLSLTRCISENIPNGLKLELEPTIVIMMKTFNNWYRKLQQSH